MNVDIIFTQEIEGIGRKGQVKSVSKGHARNFLIPLGLAELATPKQRTEWEKRLLEEQNSEQAKEK